MNPILQKQLHTDLQSNQKQSRSLSSQERFCLVLNHLGLWEDDKATYKVVCPFHSDQNASMLIDIPGERFYCFGCGVHGTTWDLLKLAYPRLTAIEAYSRVVTSQEFTGVKKKDIKKHDDKKKMMNARDYYFNLPETSWFKLEDEEDLAVKQYLRKRGFKMITLVKCGAKLTYNKQYPVTFPIMDNGVFRGYVSRTTDPDVESRRKYLYNEGFRRSFTLDGKYDNNTIVLCEGHMDMLKGTQIGIKYIAAILGWKLSKVQKQKLLDKGVKKIICALDNDEAGNKGFEYLKTLKDFKVVRLVYPEGCKDLGDINNKNSVSVLRQIEKFGGK